MLRYSFTMSRIKPFIAIGPGIYIQTRGRTYSKNIEFVNTDGLNQSYYVEFPDFFGAINIAIAGQAGLEYMVNDYANIGVTCGYDRLNRFLGYSGDNSFTRNVSLNTYLAFRLK